MKWTSRPTAVDLGNRLDPSYYEPTVLSLSHRLAQHNHPTLGTIVREMRRHPMCYGFAQYDVSEEQRVPYLKGEDLHDYAAVLPSSYVDSSLWSNYEQAQAERGDLIMSVRGTIGRVAVLRMPRALCGPNTMCLKLSADSDESYFAAYLSSSHGQRLIDRETSGTVQDTITEDAIRQVRAFRPATAAQRYIGKKVRHAERLRERARRLCADLTRPFDAMVSERVRSLGASRSWRIAGGALEHRLDPGGNHVRLVALREDLRAVGPTRLLGTLVAMPIQAGVSVSEFTHTGPLYVRISDFERGYWDSSAASVATQDHISNIKAHLRPGDVVFARIGTVGRVGFADKHAPASSLSNNCSLLRPLQEEHGPWIFWCLRSMLGDVQTACLKSQTAQPKISNEDIASILLPDPDLRPADFNERTQQHFLAARCADALNAAAKVLVERLIDGRINEADVVTAQEALDAGDRSADRTIMAALRQSDVVDEPLVPDLDILYALLDASDAEGA